jgi:hypothetical protein
MGFLNYIRYKKDPPKSPLKKRGTLSKRVPPLLRGVRGDLGARGGSSYFASANREMLYN